MNRNDEYKELLNEISNVPIELNNSFDRAKGKRYTQRRKRIIKIGIAPLASLVASFVIFVILVNTSTNFAYAAGKIPFIRELAKAVAYSPSLSAAVENQYVQPLGLVQSKNGITARIEYIIVDQKQINIFYTVSSEEYLEIGTTPQITDMEGKALENHMSGSSYGTQNGGICEFSAEFLDDNVPKEIKVIMEVHDIFTSEEEETEMIEENFLLSEERILSEKKREYKAPKVITTFEFDLKFDPLHTDQGEILQLDHDFILDGEKMTLDVAEIYPTHMRFTFYDFPENNSWLRGLDFYVENEKGERFEISDGISATGSGNSPRTYRAESAFFSESEHLTLKIIGVEWLDKDREKVRIDLENKKSGQLPQGVRFEDAVKKDNVWILYFTAPYEGDEEQSHMEHSFTAYYDENNKQYSLNSSSNSHNSNGIMEDGRDIGKDRFLQTISIRDYEEKQVWLHAAFSHRTELEEPISITIK